MLTSWRRYSLQTQGCISLPFHARSAYSGVVLRAMLVMIDRKAAPYLRPYIGAREFLNGGDRHIAHGPCQDATAIEKVQETQTVIAAPVPEWDKVGGPDLITIGSLRRAMVRACQPASRQRAMEHISITDMGRLIVFPLRFDADRPSDAGSGR